MVASLIIHPTVNGEHVMQVGIGSIGVRAAPPAVGNRVFTVVAVAHAVIVAALVAAPGVLAGRVTVDDGRADTIGGLEVGPQIRVGPLGVALDDLVQRHHQRLVTLVLGIVVVGAGGSSCRHERDNRCKRHRQHAA